MTGFPYYLWFRSQNRLQKVIIDRGLMRILRSFARGMIWNFALVASAAAERVMASINPVACGPVGAYMYIFFSLPKDKFHN